jgi:tetratricopeptide (TPR) repeat protein
MKYFTFSASVVLLMCFAEVAMAKTASEVASIARSTAVSINNSGSGVVIHRQGDLYTVITSRHEVCGTPDCELSPEKNQSLKFKDGQSKIISNKSVKVLNESLDLAVIQFSSKNEYPVAQLVRSNSLKASDILYVSGFSTGQGFRINQGKAIAVANKQSSNKSGYTVLYDADTQPGMSGGGVFNQNGELVAVHGKGEVYHTEGAFSKLGVDTIFSKELRSQWINSKAGINAGIPARWFAQELGKVGVKLSFDTSLSTNRGNQQEMLASADDYFIAGFNKFLTQNDENDKHQVIKHLSKSISLNPKYVEAYRLRGIVYQQLQENELALKDSNQLVALRPNNSDSYLLQSTARENLNDLPGALSSFNQAIYLSPQDASIYYLRATFKMSRLGNFSSALLDYNQAIQLDDNSNIYFLGRCNVKIQLQDLNAALKDCNQSIFLEKEFVRKNKSERRKIEEVARSYFARATIYTIMKNPKDAIADFDKAIKIYSDLDPNMYKLRGRVKALLTEDYQGALADYNKAIELDDNNTEAYQFRAELSSIRLKKSTEALADYDVAISRDPRNSKNYAERGFAKLKAGDYQGALADHNQAVTIDPTNATAYENRGWVKNEIGDVKGALTDYDRALLLNPNLSGVYSDRGRIKYLKLNDLSGALLDCNKAIALNPKESYAYNLRGQIKAEKFKDFAGALMDYNQAISLEPDYHRAYYNRGVLRIYHLGDKAAGIQDLRMAARIFRGFNRTKDLQEVIDQLQKLGLTE